MTIVTDKNRRERINAGWMGSTARQVMAPPGAARLLGVTSQGAFAQMPSGWVVFLTGHKHRGPLTINLEGARDWSLEQAGDPVLIRPDGFEFPNSNLHVSTARAEVWTPPLPAPEVLPVRERQARLEAVSRRVCPAKAWLRAEDRADLVRAMQAAQIDPIVDLLRPLLGRGPGLTPEGDDFVLGMLLALNRWRQVLRPAFPVENLNARVIEAARAGTTTLSANLIECAAGGLADERLITGLDGLITGQPDANACAACFNDWGSTSGQNVFDGIQTATGSGLSFLW